MRGFMYEAYDELNENQELLEENNTSLKETIVNLAKSCGYRYPWLYGEPRKIYLHHINLDKNNNIKNLCIITENYHKSLHGRVKKIENPTQRKKEANRLIKVYVNNGEALLFYDLLQKFINKVEKASNDDEKEVKN